MNQATSPDIVRWYTRARKFPQLIGRTPDGMKLWGGPYTITQACGFGLVLFVGYNTMPLWASFGFLGNFVVLGAVAAGVVFGLGCIPVGSRSPLAVVSGACRAVASPQHGRLGGRPVRLRRPRRLRHTVIVRLGPLPDTGAQSVDQATLAQPRSRRLARKPLRRQPSPLPRFEPSAPMPLSSEQAASAAAATTPALTGIQALLATAPTASQRSETLR